MRIVSQEFQFDVSHQAASAQHTSERLRLWTGSRGPADAGNAARPSARVELSEAGRSQARRDAVAESRESSRSRSDDEGLSPELQALKSAVEQLLGRKIRIFRLPSPDEAPPPPELQDPRGAGGPRPSGFGLEYEFHRTYVETESTRFNVAGKVATADGREIDLSLSLELSRSYVEQTDISIRLGDAARQKKDPLVINFGGNAADLSGGAFQFDIDGDGTTENTHFVGRGSGFLALDQNGNGQIDNGKELFGTQTGDGFAELAKYDDDGNGWIDEGDAAFSRLQIYTRDGAGNDRLVSLQEAGVGAVFLGRAATPFSYKDGNNQLQGELRSTGLFLHEDGRVGSVQQIDLAV